MSGQPKSKKTGTQPKKTAERPQETKHPMTLFGVKLLPEVQKFFQDMERLRGRKLAPQEAHLSMELARTL